MKNVVFLIAVLLLGTGSAQAAPEQTLASTMTTFGYSNSFIFVENGVSFAVYPDGEFDFYLNNPAGVQAGVAFGATAVTFNSGFNYNRYVQYDDFGAVVQVRHVPVYYDYYGRVNRIGNVFISYRNGRLFRLGGMRVYYNSLGYYNYHVGYVNPFNRYYVYQPFHQYFVRPAVGYCMVYPRPYRRYYHPVRYTYHRPYHHNVRRAYARVGQTHRHHTRAERSRIYRNDSRVVARSNGRNGKLVQSSRQSGNKNLSQNTRTRRSVATQRTESGRKDLHGNSPRVVKRKGSETYKRSSRVSSGKAIGEKRGSKIARSKPSPSRSSSPTRVRREKDSNRKVASVQASKRRSAATSARSKSRNTKARTAGRNPR